jgi:hypothetical protein
VRALACLQYCVATFSIIGFDQGVDKLGSRARRDQRLRQPPAWGRRRPEVARERGSYRMTSSRSSWPLVPGPGAYGQGIRLTGSSTGAARGESPRRRQNVAITVPSAVAGNGPPARPIAGAWLETVVERLRPGAKAVQPEAPLRDDVIVDKYDPVGKRLARDAGECSARLVSLVFLAGLNPRHFGKKFGANAGRRRLILGAERRLPRVMAICRADQGGRLVIVDRRLRGGRESAKSRCFCELLCHC